MTKKFVNFFKYLSVISGVLIVVISCEKDFKNVGVNIVDNNVFSTNKYDVTNIIIYNQNIEKNRTDRLDNYLLGTYQDVNFGKLNASIVTQLLLPSPNPDYGSNAAIDSVILNIPLEATLDGTQEGETLETIDVPNFVLDSIWSSGDNSFHLKVFELGTFLNDLDLNDPSVVNKYYSDNTFTKLDELYSATVVPNPNDTILVIKRRKYINEDLIPEERVIFGYDTIVNTDKKPSIKIPFDNDTFKTRFQDVTNSSYFASTSDFQHYFRGLYIEALETGTGNSLISLNLSQATFTIYYSETYFWEEGPDEDLNENGINGEGDIVVGEGKSFDFSLGNIIANLYDRDYTGYPVESYLNNPNTTLGSDKIYVSGAAGSDAIIHLFGNDVNDNDVPDELETLRTHENEWLINDAKLFIYVDPSNSTNKIPERLYLYNIDENGEKLQTYDAMTIGQGVVGGDLVRDSEENPEYYLFHIADYISEIIKNDTEVPIRDFGVKTFVQNDIPLISADTIMREYNGNHKNVILKGNLPVTESNRIRLEIYYTEKNN